MKPETRILVVEDDRNIAELLQLQLQHRNLKVRCEYDGLSGLEAVTEFDPEAIILDIMLPRMNGVKVLIELRKRGNRVPVLMLTARNTEMDKVHSLDMGADDYLTKPFGIEELAARIRALLRRGEGGGGGRGGELGGEKTKPQGRRRGGEKKTTTKKKKNLGLF